MNPAEEKENLVELNRREMREARFLWGEKYDCKYIKRHGEINSDKKRLKYLMRKSNAYFANEKLKVIRNKGYKLKGMTFLESTKKTIK